MVKISFDGIGTGYAKAIPLILIGFLIYIYFFVGLNNPDRGNIIGGIALVCAIIYYFSPRQLVSSVHMGDDFILVKKNKHEEKILFSDIADVKYYNIDFSKTYKPCYIYLKKKCKFGRIIAFYPKLVEVGLATDNDTDINKIQISAAVYATKKLNVVADLITAIYRHNNPKTLVDKTA